MRASSSRRFGRKTLPRQQGGTSVPRCVLPRGTACAPLRAAAAALLPAADAACDHWCCRLIFRRIRVGLGRRDAAINATFASWASQCLPPRLPQPRAANICCCLCSSPLLLHLLLLHCGRRSRGDWPCRCCDRRRRRGRNRRLLRLRSRRPSPFCNGHRFWQTSPPPGRAWGYIANTTKIDATLSSMRPAVVG